MSIRVRYDEDTNIKHLVTENGDQTLCGIPYGYTDNNKPVKKQYESTCQSCINAVKDIKKLKQKI